jgi:hypothetical protein
MKGAACRQAAALQLNGVRSAGLDEIMDGEETVPPWIANREQESN